MNIPAHTTGTMPAPPNAPNKMAHSQQHHQQQYQHSRPQPMSQQHDQNNSYIPEQHNEPSSSGPPHTSSSVRPQVARTPPVPAPAPRLFNLPIPKRVELPKDILGIAFQEKTAKKQTVCNDIRKWTNVGVTIFSSPLLWLCQSPLYYFRLIHSHFYYYPSITCVFNISTFLCPHTDKKENK